MRQEKFKMERPNLVQIGDHVEITEIQTNMNFSYIIEPAVPFMKRSARRLVANR